MNTMAYNRQQLAERQAPAIIARQAALDKDPDVQSARQSLEKAQESLAGLQSYIKGLPVSQRLQYNPSIAESKQTIRSLEQAVRTAENAHIRRDYLAKLEEKKQAEAQAAHARQDAMSEQIEQQEKVAYKPSYIQAGGKADQFETDWKERIWPSLLQQRTEQLTQATREAAQQRYGL